VSVSQARDYKNVELAETDKGSVSQATAFKLPKRAEQHVFHRYFADCGNELIERHNISFNRFFAD
jgi:hypothetical protein